MNGGDRSSIRVHSRIARKRTKHRENKRGIAVALSGRIMLRTALIAAFSTLLFVLPGCSSDQGDEPAKTDEELSGSPSAINIGFSGDATQFTDYDKFLSKGVKEPGPRICHTYTSWDVANHKAGT